MLKWGKLEVAWGFPALLAAAMIAGAGEVLPLVAVAAVCHELGHLGALRFFKVRVERMRLTGFGAEILADTRYLPYGRDLACTLAGPAVNLILALLLARVSGDYLLAGANLLQGAFNLLPLPQLDGGRALHLLLSWWVHPLAADRVCRWAAFGCAVMLLGTALVLILRWGTGLFLLPAAMGGMLSAFGQLPIAKSVKTR